MKFESKYEVGQVLYQIRNECEWNGERCKCCGHLLFDNYRWVVDTTEQEIHGINVRDGIVSYKVWMPCVYREHVLESEIGRTMFTSIEAAQAECDRLNAESAMTREEQTP